MGIKSRTGYLLGLGLVSASWSIGCGGDGKDNAGSSGSAAGGAAAQTAGSSGQTGGKNANAGSGNTSSAGRNTSGSSNDDDEYCAELDACCPTVKDATLKAAACESAVRDCSLQYAVLRSSGECREDPGAQLPEVTLDGAWSTPQSVSVLSWQGTDLSITTPTVLPCGEGDALAAWYQSDGTIGQVQAARYSAASGSWQIYSQIDKNSGLQPMKPYLAVNDSCDALVVWPERLPVLGAVSDDYALVGVSYSAAGTVSAPFTIDAEGPTEPRDIAIGLKPDGAGILTYRYGADVVRRVYTPGSGFAAATPLSTFSVSSWSFAMLGDGTALQVYSEAADSVSPTVHRFQLHTEDWSAPAELLPSDTSASSPRVVAAGDRFYVLYDSTAGLGMVSIDADGAVSEPELVSGAPSGAQLAAHGDEQIFAWRVDFAKVMSIARSGGGEWSAPEQLSADIHQALGSAIAIDPLGRAMLVYTDSKYAVFANRRDADEKWLGVHALNTVGTEPTLVANDQGAFFAAYYGSQGGLANPQIATWVQIFTPTSK